MIAADLNYAVDNTNATAPGDTFDANNLGRSNGCIESINRKLRDELLNREISMTMFEAKVLIGQ